MNYQVRDNYGVYKGDYVRPGPGPRLMGADTLIGNEVYTEDDTKIGNVKEIMLNTNTGEVSYVVLSYNSFRTDKLFAVPWEALTLDTENKRFVINVDTRTLDAAPGFDKDHWPDVADDLWA